MHYKTLFPFSIPIMALVAFAAARETPAEDPAKPACDPEAHVAGGSYDAVRDGGLTGVTVSASFLSITGPFIEYYGRTSDGLLEIADGRVSELEDAYLDEAKRNPALGRGIIQLSLNIAADGSLILVKTFASDMNAPGLELAIESIVREWDFGAGTRDLPIFLTLEFTTIYQSMDVIPSGN
jgi:hypothetical protein